VTTSGGASAVSSLPEVTLEKFAILAVAELKNL
jgi:hypothetical protein